MTLITLIREQAGTLEKIWINSQHLQGKDYRLRPSHSSPDFLIYQLGDFVKLTNASVPQFISPVKRV